MRLYPYFAVIAAVSPWVGAEVEWRVNQRLGKRKPKRRRRKGTPSRQVIDVQPSQLSRPVPLVRLGSTVFRVQIRGHPTPGRNVLSIARCARHGRARCVTERIVGSRIDSIFIAGCAKARCME
jgi:hypothetical protein